MKQLKHWQDAVNAVLGAWLALSPWAMGYVGETTAMGNALVVGLALIAVALGAILVPRAWEEWSEAALGLWAMASPWAADRSYHCADSVKLCFTPRPSASRVAISSCAEGLP